MRHGSPRRRRLPRVVPRVESHGRDRADVSREVDHADRAVRAGRLGRRHRAHRRSRAVDRARPVGDRRQPAGRRRLDRPDGGGARRARRLRDRSRRHRCDRGQPAPAGRRTARSAEAARADREARRHSAGVRREHEVGLSHVAGLRARSADVARRHQLRDDRSVHVAAPGRGVAGEPVEVEDGGGAVSRQRTRGGPTCSVDSSRSRSWT